MSISYKQLIVLALVLILLEISAFFTVSVPLPLGSHIISAIGMVLLALPAFVATISWLGWKNGSILITTLSIYALAIETAAITTGFPYGHFGYSEHLGFKLFGLTPWTVPFGWVPLMLAAGAIALTISKKAIVRIPLIAVVLVLFDLVLDPGAVLLGFWKYPGGGVFYGVPLSNFAGWVVSGAIGAIIFEALIGYFKPLLPVPVEMTRSAGLSLFFWTGIAIFGGMLWPGLIGTAIIIGLAIFYVRFHYREEDMIVLVDEQNTPIAIAPKLTSHHANTPLHRAFSIFLFNGEGQLLLQQRSFTKKTWPGAWSNSCCGHLMLDEPAEEAAKRRVSDELGITGIAPQMILPDFRYRAEKDGVVENEICPVLVARTDSAPSLDPSEVQDTKWIGWREFLELLKEPDCGFSPWAIEETSLLAENEKFRKFFDRNLQDAS